MRWVALCQLDELTEGQAKYVEVGGFQLAVFLHEGQPYVMDNYCPHAGGSLSGGYVRNRCGVCPWHHWAFDLETGQMPGSPLVKVATYKSRLLHRDQQPSLVQAQLPIY